MEERGYVKIIFVDGILAQAILIAIPDIAVSLK
jgi:hypothetical protein